MVKCVEVWRILRPHFKVLEGAGTLHARTFNTEDRVNCTRVFFGNEFKLRIGQLYVVVFYFNIGTKTFQTLNVKGTIWQRLKNLFYPVLVTKPYIDFRPYLFFGNATFKVVDILTCLKADDSLTRWICEK